MSEHPVFSFLISFPISFCFYLRLLQIRTPYEETWLSHFFPPRSFFSFFPNVFLALSQFFVHNVSMSVAVSSLFQIKVTFIRERERNEERVKLRKKKLEPDHLLTGPPWTTDPLLISFHSLYRSCTSSCSLIISPHSYSLSLFQFFFAFMRYSWSDLTSPIYNHLLTTKISQVSDHFRAVKMKKSCIHKRVVSFFLLPELVTKGDTSFHIC